MTLASVTAWHQHLLGERTVVKIQLCFALVIAGIFLVSVGHVSADTVVTVAGTGQQEYAGDGGPAVQAGVDGPFGVSLGPDGALYVCEIGNHVIRRIDESTGMVSTVAGSGEIGYSGDGGPATAAKLNEPYEVRFDTKGNMFFVEMQNNIVRRVDHETGVITTVAGTGERGFSGDDGPAVKATFSRPHSISFGHDGNLYICDIGNHRIRMVELDTGLVSTYSGTGDRQPTPDGSSAAGTPLNGPRALDFDGAHGFLLALREGNMIYRIDLSKNRLHYLAGTGEKGYRNGPAATSLLSGPKGIAQGPKGDIYFADTESHTIRVIRHDSQMVETVVGDGERGDGPDGDPLKCRLNRPHGIYVDQQGNVYIGDSSNHRVRKLVVD